MTVHQIYSFIYIFLTWVLTFIQSERIKRMPTVLLFKRYNFNKTVMLFMVFLILFMGFRSVGVGGDTGRYILNYRQMMAGLYDPGESVKDWLFVSFQFACAQIMPVSMFFLIVAFLYVFLVYVACKRLARNTSHFYCWL